MGFFNQAEDAPSGVQTPIELTRAALEAIDVTPHVDRRDSLKLSVANKEAALARAQQRLEDVNQRIRDQRQPDGATIAHALLHGNDLPPPPTALEEEKEQLVLGIRELSRQINDGHRPLLKPWEDLKGEITEAMMPLIEETEEQAKKLVESIEALYAKTDVLRRVTRSGRVEGIWRLMGAMVIVARESRYASIQSPIPVDPALSALGALEPFTVSRMGLAGTVETPSGSSFRT